MYNNDGSGLSREVVPQTDYQRLTGRLVRIVPQFSVVGTLFAYGQPDRIVASTANGLLQHELTSWQVEGDAFVTVPALSSQLYVDIFDR